MNRRLLAVILAAACAGPPRLPPEPQPQPPAPLQPAVEAPPTAPTPVATPGNDDLIRAPMPDGGTLLLAPFGDDITGMAEIAFAVAAGTDNGKQGLADFAAAALLANGDTSAGRPPLRAAIAALGGNIEADVGRISTWFGIRVPKDRWQAALQSLGAALQQPQSARAQLERVRSELTPARIIAIARDPVVGVATRFLLGDRGSGEHLSSLLDRDPSEVVAFVARNYRPERSVLAMRVPESAQKATAAAVAALAHWRPAATTVDPDAGPHGRRLANGVFWAPGPQPGVQVTLVLPLPAASSPLAAEQYVLLNCLTLDGIGGRFEQMLRNASIDAAFTGRFVQCGDAAAIALTTTVAPASVQKLWQVVQTARQSLVNLPPTDSELQLAIDHSLLSVRRASLSAWRALRTRAQTSLQGPGIDALMLRLRELRPDRRTADGRTAAALTAATEALLAQPVCLIASGGEIPEGSKNVQRFDLLPPATMAQLFGSKDAAGAQPTAHLDLACEVAGGKERLRRVVGCRSESSTTAEAGAEIKDVQEWRVEGSLHRVRKVLETTIETDVRSGHWVERAGAAEAELAPAEVGRQLRAAERHPMALLAAIARGDLRWRTIATRAVLDRDYLVLEAMTDRFERLRIHIDEDSHVIHQVESWETDADGGSVYLVEEWSDYRAIDGLRVPMRCVTDVDDGRFRRVTTFSSWAPIFAAPK